MTHPFTNWQRYAFILSALLLCHSLSWGQLSPKKDSEKSQAMLRNERYEGRHPKFNELYSNFKYTPIKGLDYNGLDGTISRRDPSKVIYENGKYYVWYTHRATSTPPSGDKVANDTIPSVDWDLSEIWYATSKDGITWEEQGVAIPRPPKPTPGYRSVATADILKYKGKYYLYYQAFSRPSGKTHGDTCPVAMSWADTPEGPWHRVDGIVIPRGKKGEWDEHIVHDPFPLVHDGKVYIYYKAGWNHVDFGGVAIADSPMGPFKKYEKNPVLNSGHEVSLFPYKAGVCALVSRDGNEHYTVQYAEDWVNFDIKSVVSFMPSAPGPFSPDAFLDNKDGRGITWGACHFTNASGDRNKQCSILARFDCDLSRDIDDRQMKQQHIYHNKDFFFRYKLTNKQKMRIAAENEALHQQMASTRRSVSLNGTWNAILDIFGRGLKKHWERPADPANDSTKLSEVYYEGGYTLNVPDDWNSQHPELFYYNGDIWYQRYFQKPEVTKDERVILRFEAASQTATVFLNGKRLGEHVGGYTPFTFDITNKLVDGKNSLIVRVDNRLNKDQIPNHDYDWCNYGGLTRDVMLDIRPTTYIKHSFVRLDKKDPSRLLVDVQLEGSKLGKQAIELTVDGLTEKQTLKTDSKGHATTTIKLNNPVRYWSPKDPFRYTCTFVLKDKSSKDVMQDKVGLRTVQVEGSKILLNGEKIFFKGVNFHEEIARDMRRACTPEDARFLIAEAKALGCNFVRLAHYPQNRYILEECDKQGLMVWEEVPLWQAINFKNPKTQKLGHDMLHEMITRDKNRACVVIWSVGNECWPSKPRTALLSSMANQAHKEDPTRLVSYAFNNIRPTKKQPKAMVLEDELIDYLDVIGVNKYLGWYDMWPAAPEKTPWIMPQKPLIISEFGAAALQGNHELTHSVSGFSEEYQEKCYRDDLKSFDQIPNLCGMAPWALFDFRSPRRSHAKFQQGWNRKGLIAPDGTRKAAWSVMKEYYSNK